MRLLSLVCLAIGLLLAGGARAVIETYEFSDPGLEQRYQALSAELRCPKCQNQNIADSNAPIAQDLRRLLYQQLEAGASDEEILAYMVSRYGEFVRYRPDFQGPTLWLWLSPLILLLVGGLIVVMTLRNRRPATQETAITAEEQAELQRILSGPESQP